MTMILTVVYFSFGAFAIPIFAHVPSGEDRSRHFVVQLLIFLTWGCHFCFTPLSFHCPCWTAVGLQLFYLFLWLVSSGTFVVQQLLCLLESQERYFPFVLFGQHLTLQRSSYFLTVFWPDGDWGPLSKGMVSSIYLFSPRIVPRNLWSVAVLSWAPNEIGMSVAIRCCDAI